MRRKPGVEIVTTCWVEEGTPRAEPHPDEVLRIFGRGRASRQDDDPRITKGIATCEMYLVSRRIWLCAIDRQRCIVYL